MNEVTILHSIQGCVERKEPIPPYLNVNNLDLSHGPGTNLKKVLSWFITKPEGCPCDDRAVIMNMWGRSGCQQNIPTILGWLRESALDNDVWFNEFVVASLVKTIIFFSKERR